jgi:hypothetical protein
MESSGKSYTLSEIEALGYEIDEDGDLISDEPQTVAAIMDAESDQP